MDWMEFYQEFADKLLLYRSNRDELVKKVSLVYEMTSLPMPKLESGELRDIDPFTVFGFFNKGITESNRVSILKAVKTLFGVDAAVPDTFTGIPVLNNMHACFYRFSDCCGSCEMSNSRSISCHLFAHLTCQRLIAVESDI